MPKLYKSVDCLVAPSRGEGWGRPQHEAMMMGLPVISTNWSGNTEFMNQDVAYLLDYELTVARSLEPEFRHYEGHTWANPSEPHLRSLMRHVVENREDARVNGLKARAHVLEHFSTKPVISKVISRLRAITQKEQIEILDVPLRSGAVLQSSTPASVEGVNQ